MPIKSIVFPAAILLAVILTGCITIPVHDDTRFAKEATHIEKTYSMPMDALYECTMVSGKIPLDFEKFVTANTAFFAQPGLIEIWLNRKPGGKTHMKSSGVGFWAANQSRFIELFDDCAKSD